MFQCHDICKQKSLNHDAGGRFIQHVHRHTSLSVSVHCDILEQEGVSSQNLPLRAFDFLRTDAMPRCFRTQHNMFLRLAPRCPGLFPLYSVSSGRPRKLEIGHS